MRTAGLVLAAGAGSRLAASGADVAAKPLLEWGGRTLVEAALAAARDGGCAPLVLVVGHRADDVARRAGADVRVVEARDWALGISASLRAGLEALEAEPVDAVCVGLADQPRVGAVAYQLLREVADFVPDAPIAVATYGGVRGNPVLLRRTVWPAAVVLTGDEGARALMAEHTVVEVDCTGAGDPTDVDTLGDLAALDDPDATREGR
ncbi:MAG: nucleotidyltransferase family protein [Actinomycetes bacterium]